jgi:hypothetical protein
MGWKGPVDHGRAAAAGCEAEDHTRLLHNHHHHSEDYPTVDIVSIVI